MAKISATVTAKDAAGKFTATVVPDPIPVPKGKHQIVFQIDDQTTNGPTIFDKADPIYYRNGNGCPSSGRNSKQLSFESCTDSLLTLGDVNEDSVGPIGYQLNLKYAGKTQHVDPIIINH
jgi:hypothetical protein